MTFLLNRKRPWEVQGTHLSHFVTKRCVLWPRSATQQDTFVTKAGAHCVLTSFLCLHQQINSLLVVLLPCLSYHVSVLEENSRVQQIQHESFYWCSECWSECFIVWTYLLPRGLKWPIITFQKSSIILSIYCMDALPGCIYIYFWRQSRYMWKTVKHIWA